MPLHLLNYILHKTHEDGGNLGTGGAATWGQGIAAGTGDQSLSTGLLERGKRIVAEISGIHMEFEVTIFAEDEGGSDSRVIETRLIRAPYESDFNYSVLYSPVFITTRCSRPAGGVSL